MIIYFGDNFNYQEEFMNLDIVTKRLKIISDLQEELNGVRAAYQESLENDPLTRNCRRKRPSLGKVPKIKKFR